MNNYFRITGYCPENDFCFILDCYGAFDAIWQFSSYLVSKSLQIISVGKEDKFIDCNIKKVIEPKNKLILRASAYGKPENIEQKIEGIKYKAIKVADKIYIPDKNALAL